MWTIENRQRCDRTKLRCLSDLTNDEWAWGKPQIGPGRRGGRRRSVDEREVVNGILHVLSTGCQWAALPKDLPPKSTVYDHFDLLSWDGTLERIHDALYKACREKAGREESPGAAIIDSRSVKSAERGGAKVDSSDYDAGKKVNGETRHVLVDTEGLLMHALVLAAHVQDRDGGILVMKTVFGRWPFLRLLYADGGYAGPVFAKALGGGAHHRLAWPLPKAVQGPGVQDEAGARIPAPGLRPPHAPQALQSLMNFPDGLLQGQAMG